MTEEFELGRVAQAAAGRVEARVQLQAHDRRVPCKVEDGQVRGQRTLNAADVRGRRAGGSCDIHEAQATGKTGLPQLGSELGLEPARSRVGLRQF